MLRVQDWQGIRAQWNQMLSQIIHGESRRCRYKCLQNFTARIDPATWALPKENPVFSHRENLVCQIVVFLRKEFASGRDNLDGTNQAAVLFL